MDQDKPGIAIEEVRRYLQGNMAPEEVKQFEDRMATDPAFAEEVRLNRELLESMNVHYKSKLKQRLQLEDQKVVPFKGGSQKKPFSRVWVMAASVALIAVAGYFLFYKSADPMQLYAEYHTTYYNVVEGSVRSGESDSAVQAFKLYDQGAYQEAIAHFQALTLDEPDNYDWLFYLGLSNLEATESEAAIDAFERVLVASDQAWLEPAQWYLGLAYLQDGKVKPAKKMFEQIVSEGNSYSDRARELLRKL